MSQPNVGKNDFHFVVGTRTYRMSLYTTSGKIWEIDARTEGQLRNRAAQSGDTPLGLYLCGQITATRPDEPQSTWNSYGEYFVDLIGQDGQEGPGSGRDGIGVHGGGTGLSNSLAARQGWVPTLGCIRLQNQDLVRFVSVVRIAQGRGGKAWLSVV